MKNDVVRSVCLFTDKPDQKAIERVDSLATRLSDEGFAVQTRRICTPKFELGKTTSEILKSSVLVCIGESSSNDIQKMIQSDQSISFHVDLTSAKIDEAATKPLFDLIRNKPSATFDFAFVFNNAKSSPYFPSAEYERNGFAIGLQPTDLSEGCASLEEWFEKTKESWKRICELFENDPDFLGIDSSVAPLFEGKSSLINFVKRLGMNFSESVTTDTYLRITEFIKKQNPKPIGLCGLMLPCLEDFELAEEYENGNFSIERNVFLSLHCGLGIDTYPIGVDEKPKRVAEILRLVQGLSNKYKKPLSVRFVSDGKAKIGEKTNFKNQYLKDVKVRRL